MTERYRDLLDAAPDGMVIVNDEGNILLVNGELERLFAWPRAELLGRSIDLLVPERLRARHGEHRADFTRHRRARWMGEGANLYGRRRDGSEFPVEISLSPLRTEEGALVLAAVRDVTARKKLEARLLLTDRLASVGTMAAGIAHEVNNPLAYVMVNLELAAEEVGALAGASPTGRLRDLLRLVREATEGAERIRRTVRGLRAFARDDEDRVPLELPRMLDFAVGLALHEFRHRARVVTEYGPVPPVTADEGRLGQVFINLLVNAAQALPDGPDERGEIRLATRTAADGRAVVEVRDNGAGIAAGALPHVFDPFFTTRPGGVGRGLGLSICHALVADLGGEIVVESAPGAGTTFRVSLPPAAAPADAPRETAVPPVPSVERGQVLVVDDEPVLGAALARTLREHHVTLATGGAEALELVRGGATFDLILCDLMMPGMSGMALHAELARTLPEATARMVFLTGGAFTSDARDFLDAVPNERLDKPVNVAGLRALVRRYVRAGGA